ncbi:hypothetical protein ACFQ22_05350 [Lentilactobacillus raoultii]|uniref:Uncharacterized protein n=1 Tax=Lentilactobacillus raoultii TaxID=1987503 RepID=A0ABW3PP97_9LACO|nr:hypothetical protein [Lentilactobacillus raoultii]
MHIRKFITGGIVLGTLFLGVFQSPTISHASNTFSKNEVSGPSGYFANDTKGVAFHWKNIKTNSGIHTVIFFGDFNTPKIQLGIPLKNSLSANKRTLTSKYQLSSTKKTRSFKLTKLSQTKYRVKLAKIGQSYLPSTSGKTYTFTKSAKSPASRLANRHTRPVLLKNYERQLNNNLQKQYQKQKAAGKNIKDPATDTEVQAKVKQVAQKATNKSLKQIVQAFN